MRRFGPWLLPLVLLLVVVGGLLLEDGAQRGVGRPLADDTRPAGAAALTRYLLARGHTVEVVNEGIPTGGATWVLAAPTARTIPKEDVLQILAFVEGGGTLVAMMDGLGTQTHLSARLQLLDGPALKADHPGGLRPTVDVPLTLQAEGAPVAGELVFAPGPTLKTSKPGALAVARKGEAVGLWHIPHGRGEVWLTSGTDLIENRRIGLGDHLAFWEGLASQGPIHLIETFHHGRAPHGSTSRSLRLTLLQLGLCLLFAGWVLGPRLGPPRPTPDVRHRSSLETVRAFGWLLRRSQVEPELLAAQLAHLRQLAAERLGVDVRSPSTDVARAVEARCGRASGWALSILQQLEAAASERRVRPARYAQLARLGAELELTLQGTAPRGVTSSGADRRAA